MEKCNVQWVRLGDYIEECNERNVNGIYTEDSVKGLVTSKGLIDTKANLEGVSLLSYKLLKPNEFGFVPDTSRRGDKMSLGLNETQNTFLVSSISSVFKVDEEFLIPLFLYLWFNRPEFDRYARFNSWGSAREAFSFEDMKLVQISLPSLAEQQKVVNVWKAFKEIKEQNEAKAAPLMQVCQSYIQKLKHQYPMKEIGPYIEECNERNLQGLFTESSVRGLATSKGLIETKANLEGVSLNFYKLLKPNEIAFVPDTSRRGNKMSLGLNDSHNTYLVSSISCVFKINEKKLMPHFLYLWFCHPEFDRYARFNSWGSAREAFSFEDMKRVKIPIPPIGIQHAIVNIYKCANEAKEIAKEADRLSREVCPALIQHVIHS